MIKSYFRIGWRNLLRNKGYSFINIGGLAAGLVVVMLIGLWIYDEISYDRYHSNHDRIARIWVNHNFNGNISSQWSLPYPLSAELRTQFSDFEMCRWPPGATTTLSITARIVSRKKECSLNRTSLNSFH